MWHGAPRVITVLMRESRSYDRRWSVATLAAFLVGLLFAVPSWGGSLALVPVAAGLGIVAWRRDRASRMRTAAGAVTAVVLVSLGGLLVFHLIWGDLA